MTREHIEFVLSEYSTDALADKLLELFDEEAASYQHTINKLNKALSENKGKPKTGHWEPKYPTREEMIYCQERYFCSNCKGYVVDRITRLEFNFCPNCGADMREPKGEKGTE